MALLPQPFGNHTTYPNHSGVDYPEASGTVIRASGPGVVTWASWFNDRAGYGTCIRYDAGCEVLYAHQLKGGPRPGQ
jgi:murein DD-endopeptidase MepM/ murein hydrolase activator NlpD